MAKAVVVRQGQGAIMQLAGRRQKVGIQLWHSTWGYEWNIYGIYMGYINLYNLTYIYIYLYLTYI